ncbi:Lectin subunit alpha [Lucilia cuprina]|nr:Lectin subunit alpha [Lucilia cuprina]
MKQPINLVLIVILAYFCSLAYSAAAAKLLFKSDEKNEYYIQPAQKFTWAQALQECDKQTMDLLTIEDAKKALEIENLLKKVFSKKPIPRFYLGAHDQEEFRTFNWITKDATKPFTYTNWESTEPNNYKKLNERCVHLGFHGSLQWNDINCERKYGFICQERTDFESLLEVIERA